MYHNIKNSNKLKVNNSREGETIETKVERIVNEKTPITDTAPMIYTDRSAGVLPELDVRFDKWDAAVDGMDKVAQHNLAKRLEAAEKKNGKTESIPATESK